MPHRPLFRLSWAHEAGAGSPPLEEAQSFARRLQPLDSMTSITSLLLLVALPVLVLTFGVGLFFLNGLLAAYALIVAILVVIHAKRGVLGLTTRDVVALAFDALACSPFAINLVRKLGLRQPSMIDPLEVAATKLSRTDAGILWRSVKRRLDDELLQSQDDVDATAKLRRLYADLEGKMS